MSSLNSILSEINSEIKAGVGFGAKMTTYGLCTQIEKNGKTAPIENVGSGQGRIIEWNDKEPLRSYHRIIGEVVPNDNFQSLGAATATLLTFPMRMVFIGTRAALTVANYEDNQELMREVSKVFPKSISTKEIIVKGEHQTDKPTVYEEEYPDVEQQHLTLDGVAFWIEYEIHQRVCG